MSEQLTPEEQQQLDEYEAHLRRANFFQDPSRGITISSKDTDKPTPYGKWLEKIGMGRAESEDQREEVIQNMIGLVREKIISARKGED